MCAAQDHVREKEEEAQEGPSRDRVRSSRDRVRCEKCGNTYCSVSKFNEHLKNKGEKFKECAKQERIYIKRDTGGAEESEEVEVVRRPHTGELETLDHVVNRCKVVQEKFGPKLYVGTLKQKVDKIIKLRIHLDEEKKEKEKAHKRRNVEAAEGKRWDPGGKA